MGLFKLCNKTTNVRVLDVSIFLIFCLPACLYNLVNKAHLVHNFS